MVASLQFPVAGHQRRLMVEFLLWCVLTGNKEPETVNRKQLFNYFYHMILRATAADAQELSDLVNAAYRGDSSRQGWTTEADLLDGTRTDASIILDLLAKPGTTLLKYVENNIILACVELDRQLNKIYLGMLTVKPGLQGKGIGKLMLQAAEQEALNQECSMIFMTVISVRAELIAWYVRQGYHDTGKRKPFEFSDPRWGIPKMPLEFIVLEKLLSAEKSKRL